MTKVTVYVRLPNGNHERREFNNPITAYNWAKAAQRRTGGTYEGRDANFEHVFTFEQ